MADNIIPAHHLAHLNEMRALFEDDQGQLVLRGLTFEETGEYLRLLDRPGGNGFERFEELDQRHETARMAAIALEVSERI